MKRGIVAAALFLSACAHKPPPPPPAPPPPPPPPPKGELLRFKAKAGDITSSHVKLLIEQEVAGAQGDKRASTKPVAISLSFGEEETVTALGEEGSELVTARLVDAVGQAGSGASQQLVDDMALAFDELRVSFKRHARGEIAALALTGLRKPLDENTARQVLNALYGAQRGQLLPEERVDVGGTWKATLPMPAQAGYDGDVRYDYTWARNDAGAAVIGCEGRAEGKKADGGKLTAKSSAEYRFDVAAGKLLASTVDQLTQVEQAAPAANAPTVRSAVRQHLRVEWTVDAAAKDKAE